MKGINTDYNTLTEIPERKYQGYIWYSDGQQQQGDKKGKPDVLKGDTLFKFTEDHLNPFVVEAVLYYSDGNEEKSIIIRHTGKYQITEFDLKNLPDGAELNTKTYFAHRIDGIKKLNFKQLWLPEPDSNCEGMEVLTLKAHIFTGFSN